jgi:hypothetical protein
MGHFRTEFEMFRTKEFGALELRVTALEKKIA